MDCLKAVQAYVDKAITQTRGIKVLLLDADTVSLALALTGHTTIRLVTNQQMHTDSNRLARDDPVAPLVARSIPHRPDRQPGTACTPSRHFTIIINTRRSLSAGVGRTARRRAVASLEMRLLAAADGREHRGVRAGTEAGSVRRLLVV